MKPQHNEDNETATDELNETPEMQKKEMESGTEMHSSSGDMSEEYQAMCEEIVKDATAEQLSVLESLVAKRREALNDSDEVTSDDYEAVKQGDE